MKRITGFISVLGLLICVQTGAFGQSEKFGFIVEAGFLKSQIGGDKLQGFYRNGYQFAIGSNYSFTEESSLLIKTAFYNQGSKRKDIFQDKLAEGIQLEVDIKSVGVEASYRYDSKTKPFYMGAGLVYHRFLSLDYTIVDNVVNVDPRIIHPDFLGSSMTAIKVFYGFPLYKELGVSIYIEHSLTDLLKQDYLNLRKLVPFSVGLNIAYDIQSKKKRKRKRR